MIKNKQKLVIAFIIIILILAIAITQQFQQSFNTSKVVDPKQELIQLSLLRMLYPYIQKSITNYYGYSRQFMGDEILDISMYGPYDIKIELKVTTFEGPHNPPYGIEVITVVLSDNVEVIDFTHRDEPVSNR